MKEKNTSIIRHERVPIEELERTIMRNAGKEKEIDENKPLKERLKEPLSYRYDWAIRQLPQRDKLKILDVGSWTGMFTYLMDTAGHDVTAFDKNQKYLEMVKANVPNAEIVKGELPELPFEDKSFDVVVALQVIEHIEDDIKAVKEMYRVLKKGGRIIVTIPIERNLIANEHKHFYNFYDVMDLFEVLGNDYTICKLNKFRKYDRPKNLFGVVYNKR